MNAGKIPSFFTDKINRQIFWGRTSNSSGEKEKKSTPPIRPPKIYSPTDFGDPNKGVFDILLLLNCQRWECSENGKTVIFLTKQNGYVGSRKEQWLTLLRARAIENQCFIAGINRVGYGGNVIYSGNSAVINPNGDIIAFGEDGTEDIIACDINPSDFKLDFITRNDRREDFYRQFY